MTNKINVYKKLPKQKYPRNRKGLGSTIVAGILSEAGKHRGQVILSKRGRSKLRKYLYLGILCLVANNPEFRAIHKNNVEVKKMKRIRSLLKLYGKLSRMLIGLAKNGETYVSDKVVPASFAGSLWTKKARSTDSF